MIQKGFRRGVAMIELIFALVIIAIVLLSSPMLINQSMSSSFVALQQEAIAAAASQVSILLSKQWDEANTNTVAPIISLNTPNPSPFNNSFNGLGTNVVARVATDGGGNRVSCSRIGKDGNETEANASLSYDDIDDYDGFNMSVSVFINNSGITESTSAATGDYVDVNLSISNSITFADDAPNNNIIWVVNSSGVIEAGNTIFSNQNIRSGGGTTESQIKFIKVNLTSTNPSATSSELSKSITLNAFSCNLGTYEKGSLGYP